MSQDSIYSLLLEKEEPITLGEIAKELGLNPKHLSKAIAKMIKYGEIMFIELDGHIMWQKYKVKRRSRLYYIKDKEE